MLFADVVVVLLVSLDFDVWRGTLIKLLLYVVNFWFNSVVFVV